MPRRPGAQTLATVPTWWNPPRFQNSRFAGDRVLSGVGRSFLMLAAFESFVDPLVIMLSRAVVDDWCASGPEVDRFPQRMYSQINGSRWWVSSPNTASLIVEFTNQLREQGLEIVDARSSRPLASVFANLMTTGRWCWSAIPTAMAQGLARRESSTDWLGDRWRHVVGHRTHDFCGSHVPAVLRWGTGCHQDGCSGGGHGTQSQAGDG